MNIQQQGVIARCSHQASLTNIFREEYDKKWSDQVINPLYVAAGWMSDGPDEQDSFKDLERKKESWVLKQAMPEGETGGKSGEYGMGGQKLQREENESYSYP